MVFDHRKVKKWLVPQKNKRGKKTTFIVACIITAILILGGIFFVVWQNNHEPETKAKIAQPVPTPASTPEAIDPNFLIQVNDCFIPTAAAYGYELRITSGFRSLNEQNQIYEQGRSEDGHIVSWAVPGKSIHNYGFAIDVVDRWHGYYIDWKKIGKIAAFCDLEQVDDAHFEHRSGLTTEQFEAGQTPGPLSLPCTLMAERSIAKQSLTLDDLQTCQAPKF